MKLIRPNPTVLLRNAIRGSRKEQESTKEINLRTRVVPDKTLYSRRPKHVKGSPDIE